MRTQSINPPPTPVNCEKDTQIVELLYLGKRLPSDLEGALHLFSIMASDLEEMTLIPAASLLILNHPSYAKGNGLNMATEPHQLQKSRDNTLRFPNQ